MTDKPTVSAGSLPRESRAGHRARPPLNTGFREPWAVEGHTVARASDFYLK